VTIPLTRSERTSQNLWPRPKSTLTASFRVIWRLRSLTLIWRKIGNDATTNLIGEYLWIVNLSKKSKHFENTKVTQISGTWVLVSNLPHPRVIKQSNTLALGKALERVDASGNYTCNIMSFNLKRYNNAYKILKRHNYIFMSQILKIMPFNFLFDITIHF